MGVIKRFVLRIFLEDAIANEEATYKFYESVLHQVLEI
jgi:hypothetical protein